jgi:hypothetical protein
VKRFVIALLVTIPVLFATPPAFAAKPLIEKTALHQEFVDNSCGFDVNVNLTGFEIDIVWTDSSGELLREIQAFPQTKQTLTNLGTGKSITTNSAGPLHITQGADGSFTLVGTGNQPWSSNPVTGDPGIFLTSGRYIISFDAQGNGSFSIVGHIVNLREKLAA